MYFLMDEDGLFLNKEGGFTYDFDEAWLTPSHDGAEKKRQEQPYPDQWELAREH